MNLSEAMRIKAAFDDAKAKSAERRDRAIQTAHDTYTAEISALESVAPIDEMMRSALAHIAREMAGKGTAP